MLCGFMSIIQSTRGRFEPASWLILGAIIADILDGRIARQTGTTSSFGAAYDSLADVISFGAAPALLAFHWGLSELGRVGVAFSFLFLVAGSIRLARFNSTTAETTDFKGLPIPAGAAAIAMLGLVYSQPVIHRNLLVSFAAFVFTLSVLMVSNLPYRSFKDLNLKKQWPAPLLFMIALVLTLVLLTPLTPYLLSLMVGLYILSPLVTLTRRARRKRISDLPPAEPVTVEGSLDEPGDPEALPDRSTHSART
jgi:CDP-diacylglycerol--serine O-phosphatidyltransferase